MPDLLVAISDPAANHVLTIANEVYAAGERIATAEQDLEKADSLGPDSGLSAEMRENRRQRAKRALAAAQRDTAPVLAAYNRLMEQIADDDLYARVEEFVWRHRAADRDRRWALYEKLKAERGEYA